MKSGDIESPWNNSWKFWFFEIGVNVIPVDSKNKRPLIEWKQWQIKPQRNEVVEKWSEDGLFDHGIALMTGKIWRGPYQGKYLVCIDIDNAQGIKEFLHCFGQIGTLDKLGEQALVELHLDAKEDRCHIYFITEKPLSKKCGIVVANTDTKTSEECSIPMIEVKSDSTTLVICSPSIHTGGYPYQIIGTRIPKILDYAKSMLLEEALDKIYRKYDNVDTKNEEVSIKELFKEEFVIEEGNNRQLYILRVMESLIKRTSEIIPEDLIKSIAYELNLKHCNPPLPNDEFEEKWKYAKIFLEKNNHESQKPFEIENENENDEITFIKKVKERYVAIFYDQLNKLYIIIKINDHTECIPLESKRFKYLVRKEILEKEGKTINEDKLERIIKSIQAEIMFDENIEMRELNLRVAKKGEVIYYDLSNQKWEIVKIDSKCWEIVKDNTFPLFKRYENNCKPQVYPLKDDKNKEYFTRFMKLFNIRNEADLLLLTVYMISLFIPEIPKVILVISGNGGGAKTTTFSLLKNIVDPGCLDTMSFSYNKDDLIQSLEHNYVDYFDNVSHISQEVSDILCRAVTGSGSSKRELYTNDGVFISKFKRCIGINGINVVTTRPDLIDRSLILKVERIPEDKRKKEETIREEFERLRPYVLGYILDVVVKVLKYREEYQDKVEIVNSPRMADFAEWAEIISRCLGYPDNDFIKLFQKNIDNQNDEIIESIPVADTLITFMENKTMWEGTPTELYQLLGDIISQIDPNIKRTSYWPKAANRLTAKINEIIPNLVKRNIDIITGERNSTGKRIIKIKKTGSSSYKSSDTSSSPLFNLHIHRKGNSDLFECEICKYRDYIHAMKKHTHNKVDDSEITVNTTVNPLLQN